MLNVLRNRNPMEVKLLQLCKQKVGDLQLKKKAA